MATQQLIIDVITKNTQRLDKIERQLNRTNRGLAKTGSVAATAGKFIAGAFAVQQLLRFASAVKNITSDFQTYNNQLRLITKGEKDRNRVFNNLVMMAKENRTAFADTVDLYAKLRVTTEQLGVSEERVAEVTSKLSKALQLAGADGNTASAVIRQFGQAMASGEVRGDEFRSLVEGLGPALSIMARETGINVGQLRKMSQSGKLNAMVMFEMLENSKAIDTEFAKMNATLEQTEIAFGDAFGRAINKIAEASGVTSKYQNLLKSLTTTLDGIAAGRVFEDLTLEELKAQAEAGKLNEVLAEVNKRVNEDFLSLGFDDLPEAIRMAVMERKNLVTVMAEETAGLRLLRDDIIKTIKQNKILAETEKAIREGQHDQHIKDHIENQKKLNAEKMKQESADKAAAEALDKLKQKNQGFIDQMMQLNEHASEENIRIRNERFKKIDDLLKKEVLSEEEATNLKVEVNKAYHKQLQKMEDDRIRKSQQRHKKNIDLIRSGKIQEIDLENATAEQKKEINKEAGRSILEQMATMNKTAFAAYKAVRIAEAIIEGKKAVQSAFAYGMGVGGPIPAFLFAGAAAAYTASQINAIKGTNFQARERGGPVQKGRPYLVGEAGMEGFVPNQSGTIIPNDQLMGTNVTVNFNINAVDSKSFDNLLIQRRDTVVGVINQAMNERGKRGLTA